MTKQPSVQPDLMQTHLVSHPLIQDKLACLRSVETNKADFKLRVKEITSLLAFAVTADLRTRLEKVTTPLQQKSLPVLAQLPVLVPVLRAGLAMAEAMEEVLPDAPVGHIGLYRDEKTFRPVEYLTKLPSLANSPVYLLDPMLATGYSSVKALDLLLEHGAESARIKLIVLIASPQGVETVLKHHPEITIYTAAIDDGLNDKSYILPGLGDAGDRLFSTT